MKNFYLKLTSAFTLAEVLITLGIVGVVAALTLPTLIASYQKKVAVERFKTSYAEVVGMIEQAEVTNGPVSEWSEWDISVPHHIKGMEKVLREKLAKVASGAIVFDYQPDDTGSSKRMCYVNGETKLQKDKNGGNSISVAE